MSEVAVRVEALSKLYRLGGKNPAYRTLREAVHSAAGMVLGRGHPAEPDRSFWALRGVDFEVSAGEVLGIIGPNGAGKSTLLKILSRITDPTEGRALVWGQVSSLLEVGTGFHPELTGRENVYLNAALLGMKRSEIRRRFDEIVAFAEVGRFIDTPLKHYSSGMQMRLAFSVAAHLEPAVLMVDEVLAVGDASFQRKCLRQMETVKESGRTILFVSHNMAAIRNLCARVLWLEGGRVRALGPTSETTEAYLRDLPQVTPGQGAQDALARLPADPTLRLVEVKTLQDGRPTSAVVNGQPVQVEITYQVLERVSGLRIFLDLCDDEDDILVRSFHDDAEAEIPQMEPGYYRSVAEIPAFVLAPRGYVLILNAGIYNLRYCLPTGIRMPIQVEATTPMNRLYPETAVRSKLLVPVAWTTRPEASC